MVVKLHHTNDLRRYNVTSSKTKWIIVDFLENIFYDRLNIPLENASFPL